MRKTIKFLKIKPDLKWYDIKTKFKQLLRRLSYSSLVQELISYLVFFYMFLVYTTSKRKFINKEILLNAALNKQPLVIASWHNRLMMMPFLARKIKEIYPDYNFMAIVSKHGDGRFVANIVEKMKMIAILGSTKDGRKSSRGIDFTNMRQIIVGLKKGYSLTITPDGPRGPNQKINGEIINIARLTKTKILAVSYSASNCLTMKSWDKFKLPLPFGRLCFYLDESLIEALFDDDEKTKEMEIFLENRLNFVQKKSQELVDF